jgi:hypothetical protein
MKTIRLYRLILVDNGAQIELASNIPTIKSAGNLRDILYESHPDFEHILIISYQVPYED